MTHGSIVVRLFAGAALLAGLTASAAAPVEVKKPVPATAPDPKAVAAVNAAVAALQKEAQAGFKEGGKLRDKSDYFGETPPPEITPDVVLGALEKSQGSDPRIDAYVKWQLLSAVPGKFPAELAARALAAYRRAPEPIAHPGLERAKLSSLLFRVGITKKDKIDELNKGFGEGTDKVNSDNVAILRYRKDLYSRLPVSGDSLLAGLDDVQLRVRRGVDANDLWDAIAGSVQSWALSADARQRDALMQSLTRLLALVKDDRAKPFVKVTWSDDPKTGGLKWQDRMGVPDNKIQALIDNLKEAAKMMSEAGLDSKKK